MRPATRVGELIPGVDSWLKPTQDIRDVNIIGRMDVQDRPQQVDVQKRFRGNVFDQ